MSQFGKLIIGIMIGSSALGCRTLADFDAASLPVEYRAAGKTSSNQVDVSSLAQHAIDQNLIYPGDVVDVTIATGVEERQPQTWPLRVDELGEIDVPLVGEVEVAGMSLVEAEQFVRAAAMDRDIYRNPHVSVLMKDRKTIQVRVLGAVEKPGVVSLPAAGSDVLAALVAAGGLTDQAGTKIEIRHPSVSTQSITQRPEPLNRVVLASFAQTPDQPTRYVSLDLAKLRKDPTELDLHVEDGSVVVVGEREKRSVSVIGLVKRADTYELPKNEELRVLDALALAGGRSLSIADRVHIIRHPPGEQDPISIAVSIKQAKKTGDNNLILIPGDIVSVEETPVTMVVGTINNFIRFGFTSAVPGL